MGIEPVIRRAWRRLRDEGPLALPRALLGRLAHERRRWLGARFDRRFGIETCGIHNDLEVLGAGGEHLAHGRRYEPIQVPVFRDIVRALPIQPENYCFIDFGSGKGRALILAAEAGFKRMIGVEFAPVLHSAALGNVAQYRRVRPLAGPLEVHCQDVTTFVLPPCDAVLFFYNPFDALVMAKVITSVERDWRKHPRDLIVAYRSPKETSVLEVAAFLQPLAVHPAFRLYRAVHRLPHGRS